MVSERGEAVEWVVATNPGRVLQEYQTEESMYNVVRWFRKIQYDTLQLPHKVGAQESDGSMKFGQGNGFAYLFDPRYIHRWENFNFVARD